MAADRQEDFVFAEHVLSRGYATEAQVEECLELLARLRGEMKLDESLANVLLKKGYLAPAQVQAIQHALDPSKAGRPRNVIRGYQLQERVGSGAMGSVYKAHHLKLDLPVALKVLRATLSSSKTQIERLKREAQLAARLNHPNIVRGLDVGESNGFHYLAMEYVDGVTVRDRIRKGPLPEKEALRIVRDVARALEHANSHGVIHRDVKPGNIMLTRDGKVKLADFGLARGKGPSDLTLDTASIGTPQYLAPEQAIRGANATHRSDLFSLGATLYHMVTGHPPFAGDNLSEIFQNVIRCRFAPPETVVRDLSLDTVYLIHHLMRAHPRERYANATALLADLERLEKGESIAPPHFKGDYQKYLRRRRARWLVFGGTVAAATVAFLVFAVIFLKKKQQESDHREFCRAANGRYANALPKAETVLQLKELAAKLKRVPRDGCSDEEVPDLVRRLAQANSELSLVAEGEARLAAAKQPGAVFRTLHAAAKRLQDGAYLKVTHERLRSIEKEIADLSRDALDDQCAGVRAAATQDELLSRLRALEQGLRDRYVHDEGLLPQVKAEADAVAELVETWSAATRKHERPYLDAKSRHDYEEANKTLDLWLDELRTSLRQRQKLLSAASLALFQIPDDQKKDLADEERSYWKDSIEGPAHRALAAGELEAAEDLVAPFRGLAFATHDEVKKLLDRIKELKRNTRESQKAEILELAARFNTLLEGRRYLDLAPLVAPEAAKRHWIPEWIRRLRILDERAKTFGTLYETLVRKAKPLGMRPAGGGDPYAFVNDEGDKLELATMEHETLARILGLGQAGLGDETLRGYFYAAESHHDDDPRRRLAFAHKALEILAKTDAWTAELRERAAILRQEVEDRERDAAAIRGEMVKAYESKNFLAALSHGRRLLEDYGNTDFVENLKGMNEELRDLNSRVGVVLARAEAGLRPEDFVEDVEAGTAILTFTFEEWFPYSLKDAPAGVKDKEAWREGARKGFWWDRFRDMRIPEGQRKARYERSIRQLSLFSEELQPDRKRGGAVLVGEPLDNYRKWFWTRAEDQVRVITLHNPFDDPYNWSFECDVMWDGEPLESDPERPRPQYPCYFALTAGDVQVGVVYYVRDSKGWDETTGKPNWPYGGGRGARIFRQESALGSLEKLLGEFLESRIPPRAKWKKVKKRKPDHRFLERWEDMTVPYRLRLRCRDGEVTFHLMKLDGRAKEQHLLTRRFSRRELDEAWKGGRRVKPFRIVSLVRCHLLRVVIEGHLRVSEGQRK